MEVVFIASADIMKKEPWDASVSDEVDNNEHVNIYAGLKVLYVPSYSTSI